MCHHLAAAKKRSSCVVAGLPILLWLSPATHVLPSSGAAIGRVGDIQAVIVLAPFAFAEHGLRNFPHGQIRETRQDWRETPCSRSEACVRRRLPRKSLAIARGCQALRRDVDEVVFGGAAVHPVVLLRSARR